MFESEKLYRTCIELTNGKLTSKLVKSFSKSKFSKVMINLYVNHYKINTGEMKKAIAEYNCLHDFFIRELKQSSRPIDEKKDSVVSPVDGVVAGFGEIDFNSKIMVKDKLYSIVEMLGEKRVAEKYLQRGSFLIFYLSPSNYHRIHAPFYGEVVYKITLGNKSYPVNDFGMKYGKSPITKNYRSLTEFRSSFGHIMMVKVGAQMINSIVTTNMKNRLIKGEELAYFSFGSTVVLLFEPGILQLSSNLYVGKNIRMGERIGYMKNYYLQ